MTAPPPLSTLRRFVPQKRAERCDLCGSIVPPEHSHLFEIAARRIVCACQACAILFEHREASGYRRIGHEIRLLRDFPMTDAEWESLLIPIGLAFFVNSSRSNRVLAFYPGPAGITESLLTFDIPVARELEPDVEALLVNRIGSAREHFIVPIDRCYRLVGLIRTHWQGLSGGEEVWRELDSFFAQLREAADA